MPTAPESNMLLLSPESNDKGYGKMKLHTNKLCMRTLVGNTLQDGL